MNNKRQRALGATLTTPNPFKWVWYDFFEFGPVRIKAEWAMTTGLLVVIACGLALLLPSITESVGNSWLWQQIGHGTWVVIIASVLGAFMAIKSDMPMSYIMASVVGVVLFALPLLALSHVHAGVLGHMMAVIPLKKGVPMSVVVTFYTVMLLLSQIALGNPVAHATDWIKAWFMPLEAVQEEAKPKVKPVVVDMTAEEASLQAALDNLQIQAKVVDNQVSHRRITFDLKIPAESGARKLMSSINDIGMKLGETNITFQQIVSGEPDISRISVPRKGKIKPIMLRDIITSEDFKKQPKMALAIGMNNKGQGEWPLLNKMPHVLVAGTSGSGKSVSVNAMILCLLAKNSPEELQLILIDPKMVEFAAFGDSKNLAMPVITEMDKAVEAVQQAVNEMQYRYQLMAHMKVKTIDAFNAKVKGQKIENPLYEPSLFSEDETEQLSAIKTHLEPLPYVVIIPEEYADLKMTNKEVEPLIVRLAQKGRAAGLHVILVTQRPDKDVVTGLIKSNVTSRLCMQVASDNDSEIVLGKFGAEKLLGNGDSLFTENEGTDGTSVQGYLVEDDEIEPMIERFNKGIK